MLSSPLNLPVTCVSQMRQIQKGLKCSKVI